MANQHVQRGISKTHILLNPEHKILGFYTLSNTSIVNIGKAFKGYPDRIPAILIGRLGVDGSEKGKGISKLLLSHALNKIKALSVDTGIAFVLIHAKDKKLATYYMQFGFESIDIYPNDLSLFLPIKDIC